MCLVSILENTFFLLNNILFGYICNEQFFFFFKYLNNHNPLTTLTCYSHT